MIKIEKQLVITIDGDEAKTLGDVCELARRMVGRSSFLVEWTEKQQSNIKNFLNKIFDNM